MGAPRALSVATVPRPGPQAVFLPPLIPRSRWSNNDGALSIVFCRISLPTGMWRLPLSAMPSAASAALTPPFLPVLVVSLPRHSSSIHRALRRIVLHTDNFLAHSHIHLANPWLIHARLANSWHVHARLANSWLIHARLANSWLTYACLANPWPTHACLANP